MRFEGRTTGQDGRAGGGHPGRSFALQNACGSASWVRPSRHPVEASSFSPPPARPSWPVVRPSKRMRLVAQVVVTAVQCQVALVDAIHTHVLACGAVQPTGQDRTGGITVLQAADLVSTERRRITPGALFALPVQATNIRAPHPLRRANNRNAVIRRFHGAAATRDPDLGKVVLYQLSYSRNGVP